MSKIRYSRLHQEINPSIGLPKSRDGTFPVADWFWIGWAPARVIGAASLALATNWPGEASGNQSARPVPEPVLCARPEIADPALAQLGGGIGDSSPSIDDVVDEQYRSPCKTGRYIAEKLHHTAALFGKTYGGMKRSSAAAEPVCAVDRLSIGSAPLQRW
jgi:hypothetical protein